MKTRILYLYINPVLVVMPENENKKLEKLKNDFLIEKEATSDKTIEKFKLLKNYPESEAVEILNYFAKKETNPAVLLQIVQLMGKYKNNESIPSLIEILTYYKNHADKESYQKVRCLAADILGQYRDDNAVLPLMYIMNDKNEHYKVRLTAAEALGKIGNPYAVVPLIDIATDDDEKSLYVRESAVKALAMIGDERAIEPLISIIETKNGIIDKFTFLKERIVETLGRFGFKKDRRMHALKRALCDESPHIKIRAIEALCEIEDESILLLVEPLIYDKDEDVARTAINAIYAIEDSEYLINLMEREKLPEHCKDEIDQILSEEDETEEDYE